MIKLFYNSFLYCGVTCVSLCCAQVTVRATPSVENDGRDGAGEARPKLTKAEMKAVVKVVTIEDRSHVIRSDEFFSEVAKEIERKPDFPPDMGIDSPDPWVEILLKKQDEKNQWFLISLYPTEYVVNIQKYQSDPKTHVLTSVTLGRYKSAKLWKMLKNSVLQKVNREKDDAPKRKGSW